MHALTWDKFKCIFGVGTNRIFGVGIGRHNVRATPSYNHLFCEGRGKEIETAIHRGLQVGVT